MQGGEVWRGFKEEGLEQELEDGIVPKSPGIGETGALLLQLLSPHPNRVWVLDGGGVDQ